jgi:hypothetical protein
MKAKVINVFLVLSLFLMVSCGGGGLKTKLVGTWEVTKIGGNEQKASIIFILSKDGTYQIQMPDKTEKGKYEVNEKDKTFTLTNEADGKKEEHTKVNLTKEGMETETSNGKFEFKKK